MALWETYGRASTSRNKQADNASVNGIAPKNKRDPVRAERAAMDDAAWRQWLDACPRYPGGCFSCAAAMLNMIFFCQGANRAVFGADVIEVELAPAAGKPAIVEVMRHGVQLDLNHAGGRRNRI